MRKKQLFFYGGLASALCIALCAVLIFCTVSSKSGTEPPFSDPSHPFAPTLSLSAYAEALGEAVYPESVPYSEKYEEWQAWWEATVKAKSDAEQQYNAKAQAFFRNCVSEALKDTSKGNRVLSPINLYMAMALTAECAEGESRAQILSLLGVENNEQLKEQEEAFFRACHSDDGQTYCRLSSSVWLRDGLSADKGTVSRLSQTYHASVYRASVTDNSMAQGLKTWLSERTGGLLDNQIGNITLSPETLAVIASTVWYRACWQEAFPSQNTEKGTFHGLWGDVSCDFMKKTDMMSCRYLKGNGFTAVANDLRNDAVMWLILPDEGTTVETLAENPDVLSLLTNRYSSDCEAALVTLILPKFDVSSDYNMIPILQSLGITDIFDKQKADFSALTDASLFINTIQHAARVTVDEESVSGAAYTVEYFCGSAMDPMKVTVTFDRPFLFFLTNSVGLPLFAGSVLTLD